MDTNNQDKQESASAPKADKNTAKSNGKKKDSALRTKAKNSFDSSAAPMSSDKFFSDYTEIKRNNVDVTFDMTLPSRLASGYVKQAAEFANYSMAPVDNYDQQVITHSLVDLTVVRKLMLSSPQSELSEIARLKDIADHELFSPKNLCAVVSNIGKFELDDYTARLKYGTQDIYRILLGMCKRMNVHKDFHDRYDTPVWNYDDDGERLDPIPWHELDPGQVVLPSDSSTRWIKDQAKKFLDKAYEHDWIVQDADGNDIHVSYPHLSISNNSDKQLRAVAAWMNKLSVHHPDYAKVAAAGICTAWRTIWTQRSDTPFNQLEPDFPDWYDNTPEALLRLVDVHVWRPSATLMLSGRDTISMIRDIHHTVKSHQGHFAKFLDLVKMPDDKFGTEAQMFPLDEDDFVSRPMLGFPEIDYYEQRFDVHSSVIAKFKNKGNAVVGIAAGLSNNVEVSNNFIARVNGNPVTLLRQILSPDFKRNY